MAENKSSFNWGYLLLGSFFITTSLVAFSDPVGSLTGLTVLFGIMAIVKGIFDLFVRDSLKILTGFKSTLLILVGILDIILGVLLLFNIATSLMALPYVFAIWFLMDSISGLFSLDLAASIGTGYYWFQLIISIIGIFVAISLFFNPVSAALTLSFLVGFYLMWIGILYIVQSFG